MNAFEIVLFLPPTKFINNCSQFIFLVRDEFMLPFICPISLLHEKFRNLTRTCSRYIFFNMSSEYQCALSL